MANSGPNTNGSQFFISYGKQPHLNGLYTIFGKVIHGFEVLDIMEKVSLWFLYPSSLVDNMIYQKHWLEMCIKLFPRIFGWMFILM